MSITTDNFTIHSNVGDPAQPLATGPQARIEQLKASIKKIESILSNLVQDQIAKKTAINAPSTPASDTIATYHELDESAQITVHTRMWEVLGYPQGDNEDVGKSAVINPKVERVTFVITPQYRINALEKALAEYKAMPGTPKRNHYDQQVASIKSDWNTKRFDSAYNKIKQLPHALQAMIKINLSASYCYPIIENVDFGDAALQSDVTSVTLYVTEEKRIRAFELASDDLEAQLQCANGSAEESAEAEEEESPSAALASQSSPAKSSRTPSKTQQTVAYVPGNNHLTPRRTPMKRDNTAVAPMELSTEMPAQPQKTTQKSSTIAAGVVFAFVAVGAAGYYCWKYTNVFQYLTDREMPAKQ